MLKPSTLDREAFSQRLLDSPYREVALERFLSLSWQQAHRITDPWSLAPWFDLSEAEIAAIEPTRHQFRFAVLPYYALLADPKDPDCPIRRQFMPSLAETYKSPTSLRDPLGEEAHEVVPKVIHRYPDRALLFTTDRCSTYCRFCTRRRIVGGQEALSSLHEFEAALAYFRSHTELREVLLTGGDTLVLGDDRLDKLLGAIRAIPHIEVIRVASRMPATAPMRVTEKLAQILRRHAPVFMMTHFNHALECSFAAEEACARLVDSGIPVYNQSVLLQGVNAELSCIAQLNRALVRMRVTPYYLHQCDRAEGVEHFQTPLQIGIDIIDGLRGHTSGLMVPHLCVDVPGGLGKVTVQPNWIVDQNPGETRFRTYRGTVGRYPEPPPPGKASS